MMYVQYYDQRGDKVVAKMFMGLILTLRTVLGCGRIRESPPPDSLPTSHVLKFHVNPHHINMFNSPMVHYWSSVYWGKNIFGRLTENWRRVLLPEEKAMTIKISKD